MLHEILLSLSGHPSPLLRVEAPETHAFSGITPPERQLLASAAHLSSVHLKVIAQAAQIVASHPSAVCRAVAAAVESHHLAAFQRKVLEVEESILRDDPDLVGAYSVVPLTAVVGEFKPWMRRMDWLWEITQFMTETSESGVVCNGAQVMNRLRAELQSGYRDVQDTAMSLVTAAETAWLKQVSAWVLYGRLPGFGTVDFFIQKSEGAEGAEGFGEEYACKRALLPSFVTPATAASMLFIGRSLNHVRVRSSADLGLRGLDHLSSKLRELSALEFPLSSSAFSKTIAAIRVSLAENTLQKLLPLSRVAEMLQLLRGFFLLGHGEFAMALTQEADEKTRNRWRRADNLAYEKNDGVGNVTVKEGEVAAVLARTWSALASTHSQHSEEDDQLELARDLLRLHLTSSKSATVVGVSPGLSATAADVLASSPFKNLLFSVPAVLNIQLPSPLDMVFSPSDLQLYSCINSYLLSMRRAHLRLTDLWKITSLRRHHPAPRGAEEYAIVLRERWTARLALMRNSWTTASAAIFFLAETEAYLQTEIVAVQWEGFHSWMTAHEREAAAPNWSQKSDVGGDEYEEAADLWLGDDDPKSKVRTSTPKKRQRASPHDPQTLSTAHALYLRALCGRLLLTQPTFVQPLYTLLVHIDYLVSHIRRLHSIFTSLDLETDAGVVDAFVDLEREESELQALLRGVERKVKNGIAEVVAALRALESDPAFAAEWESEGLGRGEDELGAGVGYVPARVGGINRLLMKLDFGSWL